MYCDKENFKTLQNPILPFFRYIIHFEIQQPLKFWRQNMFKRKLSEIRECAEFFFIWEVGKKDVP